jgi:NitT/TauT family transport system permease protein
MNEETTRGPGRFRYGALAVVVVVAVWEAVIRARLIDPLFLSAPSTVLRTAGALVASGELLQHLRASGAAFCLGFLLAVVTAVPLGVLAGWHARLRFVVDPFLSAFYATPRVALLPLIVLWVGLGLGSKVLVVFLSAFFPICLATIAGGRTVDPGLVRVARSYRASALRIFGTIVLPSSVPFIVAGLRLGVGRALVGVVVAELYAASAGVGFLITAAAATFQTDRMLVGVLVLMVFGVLCNEALSRIEARVERWRPAATEGS